MLLIKLTLSGAGKPDAVLSFEKGLNVITGDSDTGKTYAFQCLNYILGAENPPKNITEAQGYSVISLDFTVDDEPYRLERAIGSGKVEVSHNNETVTMPCKHDPVNLKNLSRYLLKLLQEHEENAFLKKNTYNEKRTLSIRDIVHLITVGETDIIAESSSFQSIQYTEKTARKSVLKYIITGIDDQKIIKNDDSADENIRRAGVVQFLVKKKERLVDKISAIENDRNYQLYAKSESTQIMLDQIRKLREDISKSSTTITENQSTIQRLEKACFTDEIKITEFKKLNHHYVEELKKNKMVSTYADFLIQLPQLNCPVCRQTIDPNIIDPADTKSLFAYFKNYTIQLDRKISGLTSAMTDITERLNDSKGTIKKLSDENEHFSKLITERQATLMTLNKNIAAIRQLDAMKKSLEIYHQDLISVESDIIVYSQKVKNIKKSTGNQNSNLYDDYCHAIENVLKNWGFSDEVKVTFDNDTLDLYINGKARSDWGKGYRAFVMSAMVIGLMRYCYEYNKLHPGFVILDSPLVSLKERKKDPSGQWVGDYMEKRMIEDILEEDCFHQVIIFENKDIKYNYQYNYIEFNHDGDDRKGFIPPDATNLTKS